MCWPSTSDAADDEDYGLWFRGIKPEVRLLGYVRTVWPIDCGAIVWYFWTKVNGNGNSIGKAIKTKVTLSQFGPSHEL